MVMQAIALAGGMAGSFISGAAQRRSAKSDRRIAEANYKAENDWNKKENRRVNKNNQHLGEQLLKRKEYTTERTTGGTSTKRTGSIKNSFNYEAMMKAAEASGINPITFLRNGGMSAFMETNSEESEDFTSDLTVKTTRQGHNAVAAYQMMMDSPFYVGSAPTVHVPGAGEAVGAAITTGANALNDMAVRQNTQDFQRELLNTQLAAIQNASGGAMTGQNTGPTSRSFYVPGFSTSGPTVKNNVQGGLSGMPKNHTAGDTTYTNPYPIGSFLGVNPYFKDAEVAETRYGDIAQELFGFSNLVADTAWNIENAARETQAKNRADPSKDPFYNLTGMTGPQRQKAARDFFKSFISKPPVVQGMTFW